MSADNHEVTGYKPPPGHVGNLAEEQQAALDKLKLDLKASGSFSEIRMTDEWLLRGVFMPSTPKYTNRSF